MFYTKLCSFPGNRFAWGGNSPSTYLSKTNLILWSNLNDTRARYMCDGWLSRCLCLSIYVSLLSLVPLNSTLNDRNPPIGIKKKTVHTSIQNPKRWGCYVRWQEVNTTQYIPAVFCCVVGQQQQQHTIPVFLHALLCIRSLLMERRGGLVHHIPSISLCGQQHPFTKQPAVWWNLNCPHISVLLFQGRLHIMLWVFLGDVPKNLFPCLHHHHRGKYIWSESCSINQQWINKW